MKPGHTIPRRRQDATRRRRTRAPLRLEPLEGRLLLSITRTWDGGSTTSSNWMDPLNWVGDQRPQPGDDLEFPAGAQRLSNINDFPDGTLFNSIKFTFGASGYSLGVPNPKLVPAVLGNPIGLGPGGIADSATASTNTILLPLQLTGDRTFTIIGHVRLGGAISTGTVNGVQVASSSVTKQGSGELVYFGSTGNTYRGGTVVNAGRLTLGKSLGNAVPAGILTIGDGSGTDQVVLTDNQQIADSARVKVDRSALLDLNGHDDALGPLTLTGGRVETGAGTLTLGGDVTSDLPPSATDAQSVIHGRLSLGGATRTFTVADGSLVHDLGLDAQVVSGASGVGLIKQGPGTMRLGFNESGTPGDPNQISGTVTVNEGRLVLQKRAGVSAITGPLVIGDGVGEDRVEGFGLATTVDVTINSSGVLAAPGSHTVNSLAMTGGRVETSLILGGNVVATSDAAGNPASIGRLGSSDSISLGGALRVFTVNDGPGAVDLKVGATILQDPGVPGGLQKGGAGTMLFESANTHPGTLVGEGTGLFNGSQPTSDVSVGFLTSHAVAGGRGLVGSITVFAGGILSPGSPDDATGILSGAEGLTFSTAVSGPGPTYQVQLNGTTPGAQYDQVRVGGPVDIAPGSLLLVNLGFQPQTGDTFTIIENIGTGPTTGRFSVRDPSTGVIKVLAEGDTFTVGTWQFTITYHGGFDANDVVLTYQGVHGTNDAPTLERIRTQVVTEGETLTLVARATDPNGDLLSFRLGDDAPEGASIHPATGLFSWTPPEGAAGVYRITIIVTDDGPARAEDTVTFLVIVRPRRRGHS
jgi:autotransporter-associated beta strand protein